MRLKNGTKIMDAIEIKGIRAYGYTGLLPEEQVLEIGRAHV